MIRDVAVVGGGLVGLATAHALARRGRTVLLLEAEDRLAAHQSGRNSGVVHAGLYYKPGSLKAETCGAGREAMYRFCGEHGVAHERCGKVVVATSAQELPALDELERRGRANGLRGLVRLRAEGIREREPHAAGVAGLYVPETGVVDFSEVASVLGRLLLELGGDVRLGARVVGFRTNGRTVTLDTTEGEHNCRSLVGCAGLHADRLARLCGVVPGLRIVPFRGEYYEIVPERRHLVNALVYPVPDPALPFLGVHLTRTISGAVEIGPNAVLALARHGYDWLAVSPRDVYESLAFGGFWRMARGQLRAGMGEMVRSLSRRAFVRAVRRLVPDVRAEDVRRTRSGVRAQGVEPSGKLVDDFRIVGSGRTIHVLSAPSPAATACLEIGRRIADRALAELGLPTGPPRRGRARARRDRSHRPLPPRPG